MKRLVNMLASPRLAIALIAAVIAVSILGSVLPQEAAVDFVFESWPMALLLGALALNICVCTLRRGMSGRAASAGAFLVHVSILVILAGALIRWIWSEEGYLRLATGESAALMETDNGLVPLGFEMRLKAFRIVTEVGGGIAQYESDVEFLPAGEASTIGVNNPAEFGGYRIYQFAFDPEQAAWSGFMIVRDPSVPLVYLGFALQIAGVSLAAFARRTPSRARARRRKRQLVGVS